MSAARRIPIRVPQRLRLAAMLLALLPLAGCKIPFMPDENAKVIEEGKAIGSGCRHALRGIEDCYNQNPDADKPAIFAGWKEMDEYMRENKMEGKPTPNPSGEASAGEASKEASDTAKDSAAESKKPKGKGKDKAEE